MSLADVRKRRVAPPATGAGLSSPVRLLFHRARNTPAGGIGRRPTLLRMPSQTSSQMVIGPSLVRLTCMSAAKRPVSTGIPSAASAFAKCS